MGNIVSQCMIEDNWGKNICCKKKKKKFFFIFFFDADKNEPTRASNFRIQLQ